MDSPTPADPHSRPCSKPLEGAGTASLPRWAIARPRASSAARFERAEDLSCREHAIRGKGRCDSSTATRTTRVCAVVADARESIGRRSRREGLCGLRATTTPPRMMRLSRSVNQRSHHSGARRSLEPRASLHQARGSALDSSRDSPADTAEAASFTSGHDAWSKVKGARSLPR
jgi:hypothetical protein